MESIKVRMKNKDCWVIKLRILALMNSYTKGISGGDMRFIEIAKRLIKMEIDVEVITSKLGQRTCQEYELKNISYKVTTNESTFRNILWLYLKRILSALKMCSDVRDIDILYSTSDFLPDTFPAFVWKLKNKNIKWIQITHHLYKNPFKRKGKNFLVNLLGFISQRISFVMIKKKSDLIIVVNPLVKKQLINLGFNKQKIVVNYNGVNINRVEKIKPSNKKYDCVFLGRLNISKGILDLIEIWKEIIKKKNNVTLAIIGSGDERIECELKNKIKENNLDKNIDVLGYLEDKRAFGILKSSKVFVFPSHEEGFGIAVLEAMACGLPVVAWNLPVYKEIFPKGIIKVTEGDYEKFANKVLELLENKKLYKKLSSEAKKVARKYNWSSIAENELKLIKEICKGGD